MRLPLPLTVGGEDGLPEIPESSNIGEIMATYEGWANYQTWNVSLWLMNDEPLYRLALQYASEYPSGTYAGLADMYIRPHAGEITPDGVSWTDPTLDHDELTQSLRYLS